MSEQWIDQDAIKRDMANFFKERKGDLSKFGLTVNQTFEAFVFVTVAKWYSSQGWNVTIVNPKKEANGSSYAKFKFSTRGRPNNYTYFVCKKGGEEVQIRHQLRVATYFYVEDEESPPANICLDVAVIKSMNLSDYESDKYVKNEFLITFGEAKHMSAFAELIANFIGLVHELQPNILKRKKKRNLKRRKQEHLSPFLYVSGTLYRTACGIKKTIEDRGYNIDIYNRTDSLIKASTLPLKDAPSKSTRKVES